MLSSAGLFALVCSLGAGKHGHPELWEMCVRAGTLERWFLPTPTTLFISVYLACFPGTYHLGVFLR